MAFRKKTLRTMSPTARKVARLIGEQESVAKRLKNLIPELQRLDLDSEAIKNSQQPSENVIVRAINDELISVFAYYLTFNDTPVQFTEFLKARIEATTKKYDPVF